MTIKLFGKEPRLAVFVQDYLDNTGCLFPAYGEEYKAGYDRRILFSLKMKGTRYWCHICAKKGMIPFIKAATAAAYMFWHRYMVICGRIKPEMK